MRNRSKIKILFWRMHVRNKWWNLWLASQYSANKMRRFANCQFAQIDQHGSWRCDVFFFFFTFYLHHFSHMHHSSQSMSWLVFQQLKHINNIGSVHIFGSFHVCHTNICCCFTILRGHCHIQRIFSTRNNAIIPISFQKKERKEK